MGLTRSGQNQISSYSRALNNRLQSDSQTCHSSAINPGPIREQNTMSDRLTIQKDNSQLITINGRAKHNEPPQKNQTATRSTCQKGQRQIGTQEKVHLYQQGRPLKTCRRAQPRLSNHS